MNILFLSAWYPFPADNGSKIRIFNLLRRLAAVADVTLLVHAETQPRETPPALAALCREVHVVPRRPFQGGRPASLAGLFRLTPRSLVDTYEPRMPETIAAILSSRPFDLVIASQWQTAAYAASFGNVPAIFEEVELGIFWDGVQSTSNRTARLRARLRWLKLRLFLKRLVRSYRAVTVASDAEAQLFHRLLPEAAPALVVPNAIHMPDLRGDWPAPVRGRMVFTGAFTYQPNHQAMRWFVEKVFPEVRAACPQAHLLITGDHQGRSLPETPGVTLTGYVEDIHAVISSAWLSLAPIFEGGGTRVKILEALALGTPVVTTSKGVEGLDLEHEEHLLIADSPQEFARAVVRLIETPALRRRLAEQGRRRVAERYTWDGIFPVYENLVRRLVAEPTR